MTEEKKVRAIADENVETEEYNKDPVDISVADEKNGSDKKPKKTRKKLHEITWENDIKYKGPLSYRHLRMIGWVCMAFMVLSVIMTIGTKIGANYAAKAKSAAEVFDVLGSLALPLFLIANFAVILNAKDGYKKMFITYTALIAVIYIVFLLVVNHYIIGLLSAVFGDRSLGRDLVAEVSVDLLRNGYLAFNVFVDLFLCTALTFFLNYRPKRFFRGYSLIVFRLCAILPIGYELMSLILKFLATRGTIKLSLWVGPILSTKPPMMFLAFIFMALFIKIREWIFLSRGKTYEEYREFLDTNINSLHFSITGAVIFLIVSIIDLVLLVLLPINFIDVNAAEEVVSDSYMGVVDALLSTGIGKSITLVAMIPLLFFFSYTRTHKKSKLPIDLIIPAAGFVIVLIVAIEGTYQVACAVIRAAAESAA